MKTKHHSVIDNTTYFPAHLELTSRLRANGTIVPPATLYVETTYPDASRAGPPTDGRPTIVLLPGGPGAGMSIYKKHSYLLSDFAHLIYLDPRGCGKSSKGDVSTYDMDTYIGDIEEVRRILKLENFILLGTSYGSMCALGFAVCQPKHLQTLILGSPVASHHFLDRAEKNLLACGTDEQKKWGMMLLRGELMSETEVLEFFRVLAPLYSDLVQRQGISDSYLKFEQGSYNWEALIEGFREGGFLKTFDYRQQLGDIVVPTLIMSGKRDWVNDICLVADVARNIVNSELHIFDCGHSFASDCNELYIQTIKKFISVLSTNTDS